MCILVVLLLSAVSLKMWEVSYTLGLGVGWSSGGEREMALFSGGFF